VGSRNDVTITDPRVEDYTLVIAEMGGNQGLPARVPAVLGDMEQLAERLSFPIAGPLIGRTLCLFAGLGGALRIFDGGCGFGYATTWIASGAGLGASIVAVDHNEEHIARAREFHRRCEFSVDFDYRTGDAVQVLAGEPGPFDLIYNDIDKPAYPQMAKLAVRKLRPGGIYVADNALWYGKVVSGSTTRDAWTAAVDQHNQWLFAHKQFFATIVDQRDGLLVAVKRS
jgi:predicted O-methyltransferase YrrM